MESPGFRAMLASTQALAEHSAQDLDEPDEEIQVGLHCKIHYIENDSPSPGFFDPVFSPERPFELL